MTDQELKQGLADLENSFMSPEIIRDSFWIVETNFGTETIQASLVGLSPEMEDFAEWTEGSEVYEYRMAEGYAARLSASGYMDCTGWLGPFDTEREASECLVDTYAMD